MAFFLSLSEVGMNNIVPWFSNLVVYFNQTVDQFFTPPLYFPQVIKVLYNSFHLILESVIPGAMSMPIWLWLLGSLGPLLTLVVVKNMFDIL